MEQLKWIFRQSWPLLLALVGGFIMVGAGVNDCLRCSSIFEAIRVSMEPWGWIGVVLTGAAFAWMAFRMLAPVVYKIIQKFKK